MGGLDGECISGPRTENRKHWNQTTNLGLIWDNMMDKSFPISFPIQELKAELDRDIAESEASSQETSQDFLAKLRDQNPQLMDSEVEAISEIKISMVLERSPAKGILQEYLKQVQSHVEKELYSQIEEQKGRPVTLADIDGLLTLPSSETTRLDSIYDKTKVVKEIQRGLLKNINEIIPKSQTIRPDIQIDIYFPDPHGAQMLIYVESEGNVLVDNSIKPPTVTLDTNVVRERLENRDKVEHVNKLLELGKKFEIDLAVTGRIHNDIPDSPLADRINELSELNIQKIGSVIRFGHWEAGIDVAGNDEFREFLDSPSFIEKFELMNEQTRPDWRDWDHVHTHYRYGRDYFLTWDKKILHFASELQDSLSIIVMTPEQFLASINIG